MDKKECGNDLRLNFLPTKKDLYDAVTPKSKYVSWIKGQPFSVLTLQREACSSREAVFYTLKNMLAKNEQPSPDFEEN